VLLFVCNRYGFMSIQIMHADEKSMPRIASWVNLYIGRKYDAVQLISSIKANQVRYMLCC